MINVVPEMKERKCTHIGINIGTMPLNRLSILVNDELGEVPLNEAAKEIRNHITHNEVCSILLQSLPNRDGSVCDTHEETKK
jgi:peroxiredoxin